MDNFAAAGTPKVTQKAEKGGPNLRIDPASQFSRINSAAKLYQPLFGARLSTRQRSD
jgi:hypothetical protein